MSTFTLTLDTQAPSVTLGSLEVSQGVSVSAPYEVDEPAVQDVYATNQDGDVFPGQTSGGSVTFNLGGKRWDSGTISFVVEDDVWNSATRGFYLPPSTTAKITTFTTGAWMSGEHVRRGMTDRDDRGLSDYERAGLVILPPS